MVGLRLLVPGMLILAGSASPAADAGRSEIALRVDGWDRTAQMVVPTEKPGRSVEPRPLVLILHGAGGSGAGYLDKNGWADQAETAGFIAVAPDGLPRHPRLPASFLTNPRVWNSGQLTQGVRTGIDDVRFLLALLDDVAQRTSVDRRRVYVTGHSNGGSMTWRLAAEAADRFAAAAPVCGLMAVADPHPVQGIPVWAISGELDPLQPLLGGESHLPWGSRTTPPVRTGIDRFAVALGCPPDPRDVPDRAGLTTREWGPGKDGAHLRWTVITGHGHGWPGGRDSGLPEKYIGPSTTTLVATPAIWAFFADRTLPPGP